MRALLISTYELGRQPFALASAAAWLRRAGIDVECADLSRDPLVAELAQAADLAAFSLPMHTATRLALPVVDEVRRLNPRAHLCAFGIYAPPNAAVLRARGVETILGGEFEADLASLATRLRAGEPSKAGDPPGVRPTSTIPRLSFIEPDRSGLPPLQRYASLQTRSGELRVAGYTEASRGCKHRCRHCPVVPVYRGTFRIVPEEIVIADIRRQVEAGAQHVSFGDPDFFNGIGHALRIAEAVGREFPGLTYDVVIKIEHLLNHARSLRVLRDTGCLFVTSAVESVDDRVLALLEKGHSAADFDRAVAACRAAEIDLSPTFVPFTPWTTLAGYCALLETIVRLDLADAVAPIQLAIRLLVPEGSRLLELPELQARLGTFDPDLLAYPWTNEDSRVDALQREVLQLVARHPHRSRRETFEAIREHARGRAGLEPVEVMRQETPRTDRAAIPFITEPWYC